MQHKADYATKVEEHVIRMFLYLNYMRVTCSDVVNTIHNEHKQDETKVELRSIRQTKVGVHRVTFYDAYLNRISIGHCLLTKLCAKRIITIAFIKEQYRNQAGCTGLAPNLEQPAMGTRNTHLSSNGSSPWLV